MCGIAGLIRHKGLADGDKDAVARMIEAQAHRGPDGSGCYSDGRAVLGHRRLSIIDLSDDAAQPMPNEDRSVWVTYNGEIYNHGELWRELFARGHRFRSRSDTEVIVHGYEQWGLDGLLARLRGMFALALYDERVGLLLARDRLGIKPLYYSVDDKAGLLLFASEVKALLRSGLTPNDRDDGALVGYLLMGSIPAPRTMVKDVHCLLPGHYLQWQDGRTITTQYWDVPSDRPSIHDAPPAPGEVQALLRDSVSRHLVSDVPLGVFLSGGVDSGAVVALAAHAGGPPLKTLTVTFGESQFSEAEATRAVATRFGTDHHEVHVTREEFAQELPRFFAAMDQPTNDGVNTYFVSKAARKAGLTVVLSGLGGDEVFWGYKHYRWLTNRGTWMWRCPSAARKMFASGATWWGRLRGRDNWMRAAFLARGASSREVYLLMRGFFPPQHVQRLLGLTSTEVRFWVEQNFADIGIESDSASADGVNYIEMKRYMHDQLLRDSDVFSMAHSIELRVPLLDHPLVEAAAAIPARRKAPNGVNKPLLVNAVNEPLVRQAGTARKRGFSFPMREWMQQSANELEEMSVAGHVFEERAVHKMWKAFRHDRLHWSRAWSLTVVGAGTR